MIENKRTNGAAFGSVSPQAGTKKGSEMRHFFCGHQTEKRLPFYWGRRSDRGVDCSVRALFFFQAEIFHFPEQGTPVHTEAVRRRAAFPVVLLQCVQQVDLLETGKRFRQRQGIFRGFGSGRLCGGLTDDGIAQPCRPQTQVLVEHILQLADIAGPVIDA